MNYFISALIVIWLFAALFLLFSLLVFNKNFRQSKKFEDLFFQKLKNSGNEEFEPEIKSGRDFILSLPFEEVRIWSADEFSLYGKLYTPDSGEGQKSVLLLHSFGKSGELDFAQCFAFYRDMGFNILIADERGCGKSGGKYSSLGVSEGYDAVLWCSWLELRFGTGSDVFIHGKQEGALAAAFACSRADLPQNVKGFISQNPIVNVYHLTEENVKNSYGFLSGILMPCINMFCKLHIGFDMRAYSLYDCLGKIKTASLFIDKDKNDILNKFKTGSKILILSKSEYCKESQKEIKKAIAEFINETNG